MMAGHPLVPLAVVLGGAIILVLLESFLPGRKNLAGYLSLVLLALACYATLELWKGHPHPWSQSFFQRALLIDQLALCLYLLLFACSSLCVLTSLDYLDREGMPGGEYFALLLFALGGMMIMVSSNDFLSIFLGLEILSLSTYIMVGMQRADRKANEATLKYFYLGAFSAGIFLYGIALTYGAWGTTRLDDIYVLLVAPPQGALPLAGLGAVFMLAGLAFKVAAVPFHSWVPDVYEASPSPLVGFMASAVKASAYAVLLRFLHGYIDLKDQWGDILWWLCVLTMFTGNALALVQNNVKRMLAYSSVAHSGYALVGLVALSEDPGNRAGAALLYYLFAYAFATLGTFGCVAWLSQRGETLVAIEEMRGLGHRYPLLGVVLSVCLCSLIGIPPTAGFFGKYYLLAAAISEGYLSLAILVIVNSILSIYYYLRIVVILYLGEPAPGEQGGTNPAAGIALTYTAVAALWCGMGWADLLGIVPGASTLINVVQLAVRSLW